MSRLVEGSYFSRSGFSPASYGAPPGTMSMGDWRGPFAMGKPSAHLSGPTNDTMMIKIKKKRLKHQDKIDCVLGEPINDRSVMLVCFKRLFFKKTHQLPLTCMHQCFHSCLQLGALVWTLTVVWSVSPRHNQSLDLCASGAERKSEQQSQCRPPDSCGLYIGSPPHPQPCPPPCRARQAAADHMMSGGV